MKKLKIGDKVNWICKPFGYPKQIKCTGIITQIKESTFGGSKSKLGANVLVFTKEYINVYKGRCKTFISIDKLIIKE